MTSRPSGPPLPLRWLRVRPERFALATAILMIIAGLVIFSDPRPALAGGAISAVLVYLAWSPGGLGWRLDAHQRRLVENGGELGVRPAWLLRAVLAAVAIVLVLLLVALLAS